MTTVRKSLTDVGRLATLLVDLQSLQRGLSYERIAAERDTAIADRLRAAVATLAAVLVDLVGDETAELDKLAGGDLRKAAGMSSAHSDNPALAKLEEIMAIVKVIEAQPMPGGPVRMQPPRFQRIAQPEISSDALAAELSKLSPEDLSTMMIKLSQQQQDALAKRGAGP